MYKGGYAVTNKGGVKEKTLAKRERLRKNEKKKE